MLDQPSGQEKEEAELDSEDDPLSLKKLIFYKFSQGFAMPKCLENVSYGNNK